MDPYIWAILAIILMFAWCFWKVWQMKKSFESRNGSYEPFNMLLPEWLRKMK